MLGRLVRVEQERVGSLSKLDGGARHPGQVRLMRVVLYGRVVLTRSLLLHLRQLRRRQLRARLTHQHAAKAATPRGRCLRPAVRTGRDSLRAGHVLGRLATHAGLASRGASSGASALAGAGRWPVIKPAVHLLERVARVGMALGKLRLKARRAKIVAVPVALTSAAAEPELIHGLLAHVAAYHAFVFRFFVNGAPKKRTLLEERNGLSGASQMIAALALQVKTADRRTLLPTNTAFLYTKSA